MTPGPLKSLKDEKNPAQGLKYTNVSKKGCKFECLGDI